MRTVRDSLAHALIGAVGLLFGVLSAIALAVAALVPPALGLLAFLASPIRALIERLRGARGS
ncbi:MAG TPA: hypothetical protein VE127_05600 [Solirubrobacteraceae bacterium]|nr:hypothetical protein [Solirubrobacteraceae bacterium]